MFAEKQPVMFKNMTGLITFICNNYVVMEISPAKGRSPAKLLIYCQNFKDIIGVHEV